MRLRGLIVNLFVAFDDYPTHPSPMLKPVPYKTRRRRYKHHGLTDLFRTLKPMTKMPEPVSEKAARSLVTIGGNIGWVVWRNKISDDAYEVGREK